MPPKGAGLPLEAVRGSFKIIRSVIFDGYFDNDFILHIEKIERSWYIWHSFGPQNMNKTGSRLNNRTLNRISTLQGIGIGIFFSETVL